MIPMAEEAELAEKERMIESIATVFGKDGLKVFLDKADQQRRGIRARALAARGVEEAEAVEDKAEQALKALQNGFAGLGAGRRRSR